MGNQDILKFCLEKGLLVDKDFLSFFEETGDTESVKVIIEKIKSHTQDRVLTKNTLNQFKDKLPRLLATLPRENQKQFERLKIKLGLSIEIEKELILPKGISDPSEETSKEMNFQLVSNPSSRKDYIFAPSNGPVNRGVSERSPIQVTEFFPPSTKKLEVKDFVNYFRSRVNEMRTILSEHHDLNGLVSINKLSNNRQNASLIGIVSNKSVTKNKNIIFELEDLTGKIKVLINANKPELLDKAEEVALDSVIGFKGSGNREIFFASEIVFPEAMLPERKRGPVEEYACFIGDFHVGSKRFLEEEFLKFVDYLNCKIPDTPEASKIKYLFIVGDLIAGVGEYPGQEKDLIWPDVEKQYEKVAELLGKIRKDIWIILSPGNHDALRIMEPQPLLNEKYSWSLYALENVIFTGNPSQVNIGSQKGFSGFDVLTYHGMSFHYYANHISVLMKEKAAHKPDKIMHYLLKNRHLAPTHSSVQYFPLEKDSHIIRKVPDIMVSGHTHKSALSYYNNVLTISVSCWESKTPYQEKMGNEPDFCKVPLFNLKTGAIKVLDFEDYSKENSKVKA